MASKPQKYYHCSGSREPIETTFVAVWGVIPDRSIFKMGRELGIAQSSIIQARLQVYQTMLLKIFFSAYLPYLN